ncbi:MAG: Calx-beta domain-containing protein, partial [Methylococcaceae bacterium]
MATKTYSTLKDYLAAKPTLTTDDIVTINSKTLTAAQVATLGLDAKVDIIRVPSAKLNVSQFNAAAAKLQTADKITIVDTSAVIQSNLSTLLADPKIDAINSSQDAVAIKLTVAQAINSANVVKLQTADFLVVADTSAAIQANLPELLANPKIDAINSSQDGVAINLTVAQAMNAVNMVKLQSFDTLAVVDKTAAIQANLPELLANPKVDAINSSQDKIAITLTAEQAIDPANMAKLQAADKVVVVLTADDTLTPVQAAALHANPKIDTITNSFSLDSDVPLQVEGKAITFTVTRIDPTNAEKLSFNVVGDTNGGTVSAATLGTDYTPASGVVSFAAGSTTATVTVNVLADALTEGLEGLKISLFNGSTVIASTAVLINDDPDLPDINAAAALTAYNAAATTASASAAAAAAAATAANTAFSAVVDSETATAAITAANLAASTA